jgi:hypothetical protein
LINKGRNPRVTTFQSDFGALLQGVGATLEEEVVVAGTNDDETMVPAMFE